MKVGDIVLWKPKSIALRDLWCIVEVTKTPDYGFFSGKVIDQKGFDENMGHEYDDWIVSQVYEF